MSTRLLKPRPMIAIEPCAICGRAHVDPREYRRCSVCGEAFCWLGERRGADLFGVENRACGSRRTHSADDALRPLAEYRCRRHASRSWRLFGADWVVIRPLALYVFVCVAFSIAFWGLLFLIVVSH
jgi:hypothetical protein